MIRCTIGPLCVLNVAANATRGLWAAEPRPPVVIIQDRPVGILQRPDGSFAFFNLDDPKSAVDRSTLDGRRVTLKPRINFQLPPGTTRQKLLLDEAGELHEVYLQARGEGGNIAVDRFIDLWHRKTSDGRAKWDDARPIWEGYCGALMHFARLPSGRMIAPFGQWMGGRRTAPPTGANVVTAVFSDDGGATWTRSPSRLFAPCYDGYNGNNYGACEPAILRLADGRLYMLMRTQAGFLYESWSADDGATWAKAVASQFSSSSGPPGLTRLGDGRIAMFWNNCEMPPRVDGEGVYGGRDAMAAAISDDEGKTWRGFREVYRDPYRNDTPPRRGDRGTAYPFGVFDQTGDIILVTGQGRGRRNLIKIDPAWLTATVHEDDFSAGLASWHVFKPFGPAIGYWRDRTVGPELVDHPTNAGAKALRVRNADDTDPDGATWNFPIGWKGKLTIRLMLESGFGGASIALADRMFEPTDEQGERLAIFHVDIDLAGRLSGGGRLELEKWHTLAFRWNLDEGACLLTGESARQTLKQLHPTGNGICYLRLRSTAQQWDEAGMLVDHVRAEIENPVAPVRTVEENATAEQHYLKQMKRGHSTHHTAVQGR